MKGCKSEQALKVQADVSERCPGMVASGMQMGPVDGTHGSSDTAKLQPISTQTSNNPYTQFPLQSQGKGVGAIGRRNRDMSPLTTDPTAVAKGLQRALACQRWALPA